MEGLNNLVKQNIRFRFLVGGEPVSRAEIEDTSLLPKPILKGGAANRLWTIEPLEEADDHTKPLACLLRCDGVLVGQRNYLVYAFYDEEDQKDIAKWVVEPGKDVDGSMKLNVALVKSPFAWRDPDHWKTDGGHLKQIPITESLVPEFKFTLEPVFD